MPESWGQAVCSKGSYSRLCGLPERRCRSELLPLHPATDLASRPTGNRETAGKSAASGRSGIKVREWGERRGEEGESGRRWSGCWSECGSNQDMCDRERLFRITGTFASVQMVHCKISTTDVKRRRISCVASLFCLQPCKF